MGENQTIDLNQAQYITDIEGHLEPSLDLNELARRGIVDAGSAGRTHPLAPEERALISTKGACIAGHLALTGYSVLIGSQKYLVPTIQIVNPESLWDSGEGAVVKEELDRVLGVAKQIASKTGGLVGSPSETCSGCAPAVWIEIFIPMAYAIKNAVDFASWKAHLEAIGH